MGIKVKIFSFVVVVFIISLAFKKSNEPALFSIPPNFPQPTYDFTKNPLTREGVALGKSLFYDAALSKDNSISCGSCHQQAAGFTQYGHALSHGVGDRFTKRNSMPLANMAWSNSFGWDGGVHDLDLFPISPITNPLEMDESMPNVLQKLRYSTIYPKLFEQAFGSDEINTERFLKALSQFMLTMVSANSKYDQYLRNQGVELSPAEAQGLSIFNQKCSSCHAGVFFTDFKFRNNGLKPAQKLDEGRYEITLNEADKFKFKVPSLRNLSYTAPYMHDGRFTTLSAVLDHYSASVVNSPTLDPLLKQNEYQGIALSNDEKQKVLAFLKTLDDPDFLKNTLHTENSGDRAMNSPKKSVFEEVILIKELEPQIEAQLQQCLIYYLKIKNAMLTKNSNLVAKYSDNFINSLVKIDKNQLAESQREFYEKLSRNLVFNAEHLIEGKGDFEHQFDHFGDFSKNVYVLIASFKPNKTILYYYYCQKGGGNWLSDKSTESTTKLVDKTCGPLQMKTILP